MSYGDFDNLGANWVYVFSPGPINLPGKITRMHLTVDEIINWRVPALRGFVISPVLTMFVQQGNDIPNETMRVRGWAYGSRMWLLHRVTT